MIVYMFLWFYNVVLRKPGRPLQFVIRTCNMRHAESTYLLLDPDVTSDDVIVTSVASSRIRRKLNHACERSSWPPGAFAEPAQNPRSVTPQKYCN